MHWHEKTGQLMTCSTDRGIIIWKEDANGKLLPQLVIIKELKANLDA
jgi:hypothetical protein